MSCSKNHAWSAIGLYPLKDKREKNKFGEILIKRWDRRIVLILVKNHFRIYNFFLKNIDFLKFYIDILKKFCKGYENAIIPFFMTSMVGKNMMRCLPHVTL